jgi:flagellar protein FlaJ
MFEKFRTKYLQAGIGLPYKKYITILFLVPVTILIFGSLVIFLLIKFYNFSYFLFFFPIVAFLGSFVILFAYPYDKRRIRRQNIDTNLPYALSYMASIMETGISPVSMFEAIARFDEYEEVSKEASNIVRQTKILGKDLLSVLENYSDKTPSDSLREVLKGMVSVAHAGGSISSFLRQKYNEIMFKKVLKESEYEKSLDVYENIFTTLLVIAPILFFIIVFLGESMSPGSTPIVSILKLATYLFLPIANIGFIVFLKFSRD